MILGGSRSRSSFRVFVESRNVSSFFVSFFVVGSRLFKNFFEFIRIGNVENIIVGGIFIVNVGYEYLRK